MNSRFETPFSNRMRELYPGGPKVSLVGFGASRLTLGQDGQDGRTALQQALKAGLNLIDCAAAAKDAQSELAVAKVLAQTETNKDDLNLIIKVGQARGQHLEALTSELWADHGKGPSARVMMLSPDHGLCLDGDLVEGQVLASIERLGGQLRPVVLLEMPEDCIRYAAMRGLDRNEAFALFTERMQEVLGRLRSLVAKSVIRAYGVCSESLGYPPDHPLSYSLAQLVQWNGGEVGDMKVVSIPLNWIEWRSAVRSDDNEHCFWRQLRQFEMGLIAHRPFNALSQGQLIRLARPHLSLTAMASLDPAQSQALERWASLVSDLEHMGREVLVDFLPEEPTAPLSQLVLSTLTALPELSAVLVGMTRPEYVDDVKKALSLPRPLRGRDALDAIHARFEFAQG